MAKKSSGVLYLCATPIGNLEDITMRALRLLGEVDLVAAEDTRRTRKLLNYYEIKATLTSYHEHNKKQKGELLLDKLIEGKNIALVTDAGLPGISDPGEDIVRLALDHNIDVIPVPGASAGVTALVISGFPAGRYVFEGFLPTDKKKRNKRLEQLKTENRTIILYESPHRMVRTSKDLKKVFGSDHRMVVARELTKLHEEVLRGTMGEFVFHFGLIPPRGEFTLVIEGSPEEEPAADRGEKVALLEEVAYLLGLGVDKKTAIREVADKLGMPKREVYNAVHKEKREKETP